MDARGIMMTQPGMVGDYVQPDGWPCGHNLITGDAFSALRLLTGQPIITSLAVKVIVTGRKEARDGSWRCKIVFLGDCDPDTAQRGRIWIK